MKTLARHSLWLFLARLATQAGMALFTIMIARRLGSADFGQYAFMASLIVIGNTLTTFGTDMHLIREIAARDDLSMLPAALILQIVFSTLFIAAIFLFSPFFVALNSDGLAALRVHSFSLFPLAFFTVFSTALRGKQQMGAYALLNLTLAGMQVIVALMLYLRGGNLLTIALLLLLTQVIAALLAGVICKIKIEEFLQLWRFDVSRIVNQTYALLHTSAPIALLGGLGTLYQRLGVILLPFLVGAAGTGLYSASARLVEAAKLGHIAVFTAIYPQMSESKAQNTDWFKSFRLPWWVLIAGATIASLVLSFLAGPLTRVLFGAQYIDSAGTLKILAWVLVPYTINSFLALAFLAEGREKVVLGTLFVSLIGLVFITVWWTQAIGPIGAAWAVLVMEVIQSVVLVFLLGRSLSVIKRGGTNEFPNLS